MIETQVKELKKLWGNKRQFLFQVNYMLRSRRLERGLTLKYSGRAAGGELGRSLPRTASGRGCAVGQPQSRRESPLLMAPENQPLPAHTPFPPRLSLSRR